MDITQLIALCQNSITANTTLYNQAFSAGDAVGVANYQALIAQSQVTLAQLQQIQGQS